MLICDGLKGLPDAVGAVREKTNVHTCIVHRLRNSFKYAPNRDWADVAKDHQVDEPKETGAAKITSAGF